MKKFTIFGALACTALAAAQSTTVNLQPIYTKMAAATQARKFKALETLLNENTSANFAYVAKGGKRYSMSELFHGYKSMQAMVKYTSFQKIVEKTSVSGSTAQLSVRNIQEVSVRGTDGKPHKMRRVEQTLDTWVRQNGKWQWITSRSLSEKNTMDGRPIPEAPR